MDPQEYLLDWAFHYAQHKTVFHSSGEEVSKHPGEVKVKGKETLTYIPVVDLEGFKPHKPAAGESIYIVTFNTEDNLDTMVKHWKTFSETKNILVIFLNPFSRLDKKWSIHPYIHNRICDEKALKPGLKSIAANVDGFKKSDFAKLKTP